jgi:putative transposase
MKDRRRLNAACNETEVSLKTYRRWLCGDEITVDKRRDAIRPEPGNKLSEQEHQRMIETCNEPEYANFPRRKSSRFYLMMTSITPHHRVIIDC